jgi:molybdopterin converting factor small subunit
MKISMASPLQSYTGNSMLEAHGKTLAELLEDLERRFPGIRFRMIDEQHRIRRHLRIFVNDTQVFDLDHSLQADDEIHIVQALSGG